MMLCLRFITIIMVGTIALFFSIVAFNNIVDFNSNFLFVQHVLNMDTTFRNVALMRRAITDPAIQSTFYYVVILWEIITAVVCWCGSLVLLVNIKREACDFHAAKTMAFIGLFLGFLLYMGGFIIVGGEWFGMWQSSVWNGQMKAGLFISFIMFVMIFIQQNDRCCPHHIKNANQR